MVPLCPPAPGSSLSLSLSLFLSFSLYSFLSLFLSFSLSVCIIPFKYGKMDAFRVFIQRRPQSLLSFVVFCLFPSAHYANRRAAALISFESGSIRYWRIKNTV